MDTRDIKTKIGSDYFLLFVIAAVYVITVFSLALAGHYAFQTNAWDLGIYTQAFHSTLNNGKIFYYTAELPGNPSGSLFGIHFSPFLFLLVPIYAIYQSPVTLLILRPIAISIGLIPLYWILRDQQLNSKGFVVLFAIVYLVYLPVAAGYLNFDVEAFLPALFLFAIHYLKKGKLGYSYVFVVLALMINEFVPLIIIAMAVYSFLLNRKEIINGLRQRKLTKNAVFAIILFLSGVLWFKLSSMVIAYFNPSALSTKWEWGELGTSPDAIITSVLTNPVKTLQVLFNDGQIKVLYMVSLLGPVAFFSLLDPLTCIMTLPWLAASMLSVNPSYYSIGSQYPAFISAFIFVSAINGLKKLVNIKGKKNVRKVFFLVPIMLLITTLLIPAPAHVEVKKTGDAARFALEKIPANASASVMPEFFPHICNRLDVYPYFKSGVDYVLIDVYSWWYNVTLPRPADAAPRWCDAEIGDEYGLVVNSKGVLLYEKGYRGSVIFEGVDFTYTCHNVTVEAGKISQDNLTIAGLHKEADVLVHRIADFNPLFFSVPETAFPPGRYNVTVILKVTATVPEDVVALEIKNKLEDAEILTGKIRGVDFAGSGEWQVFSFSFSIDEPTFMGMKVDAGNSTDAYFYSLNVLQVSGSS
jgi:uncharacterized membrane protein